MSQPARRRAAETLPLVMQDIHDTLHQTPGQAVANWPEGYGILRESLDRLWGRVKRPPELEDETYDALVLFGADCCLVALRLCHEGILPKSLDIAVEHITRRHYPPVASLHDAYGRLDAGLAVLRSYLDPVCNNGFLVTTGQERLREMLAQVYIIAADLDLYPVRPAPAASADASNPFADPEPTYSEIVQRGVWLEARNGCDRYMLGADENGDANTYWVNREEERLCEPGEEDGEHEPELEEEASHG